MRPTDHRLQASEYFSSLGSKCAVAQRPRRWGSRAESVCPAGRRPALLGPTARARATDAIGRTAAQPPLSDRLSVPYGWATV
jgi:hypothetical protein